LAYRGLRKLKPADILQDAFDTACMIGMRGSATAMNMPSCRKGSRSWQPLSIRDISRLILRSCARPKTASLATLLLTHENHFKRFNAGQDISSWMVSNPDYNKLNKVKKTSPEAFFYFFRALELLRLVESK